jgi:hypothetical protein
MTSIHPRERIPPQRRLELRPAQGDPSHQTEPSRPSSVRMPVQVSALSQDLSVALGCRVEVSFLPDTLEVVTVAYPEPNREVRVTILALPAWLPPLDNPYHSLKHNLLRELRHRISQEPGA